MNNAQFRKLLETPRAPAAPVSSSSKNASSTAFALGSKQRSSIPMTPRNVKGSIGHKEFARQLAANNAASEAKPQKKFRSSAAPLGTKLPSGYVDRSKQDREGEASGDREARLETLRKLAEEGGIDREEYILQTKLLGGDVESTHLVKGLDFKLLEKVRRGEDVMNATAEKVGDNVESRDEGGRGEEGEEDELDRVLNQDIAPVERPKEERKKKGTMASASRAEILAELKRSREAAKPASMLGAKFKKIGVKEQKEEVNGVKVKYITGADGKVKKMVKKSKPERELGPPIAVSTSIMGMTPLLPPPKPGKAEEEDEDIDIFEGVGTEYNPLAGLEDDDDSSSEEEGKGQEAPPKRPKPGEGAPPSSTPPSLPSKCPTTNYFNEPLPAAKDPTPKTFPTASSLLSSNPDLAAALAKASTLKPLIPSTTTAKDDAEKRRKALIEASDRDAFDIDFGFGGSRNFEDDDDDDYAAGGGGAKKRKRGGKGKKGKGDKNDASVVGKVVEERYGKKK